MLSWIEQYKVLLSSLGIVGLLLFLGTLVVVPWLIVRLPTDYFALRHLPRERPEIQHPILRLALRIAKNALGVLIVLTGLGLLLLPGQGILTILIGLAFLDFPGKRALELRIVRERHVLKTLNWIRAKGHREPLKVWREKASFKETRRDA